jgi:hypothetical protein
VKGERAGTRDAEPRVPGQGRGVSPRTLLRTHRSSIADRWCWWRQRCR